MLARSRDPALQRHPTDGGTSLVEVLVTMAVLGVVMSIFTTGILQAYRTANSTDAAAIIQTQLSLAFQRLDKEIRYASWIAVPGATGGAWYVEFAVAGGCRQLRLDDRGTLQMLRWTPGAPPAAGAAGQTLAAQLVYDTTTAPFVRQAPDSHPFATSAASPDPAAVGADFIPDYYRLQVRLTAGVAERSGELDSTFTAVNTSRATPAANTCGEGRP